jgi:O-antigen/teichoic acid export membrane protein
MHAGGDAVAFRALTRKLVLAGALLGVSGVALSALAGRRILELLYRPEFGAGAHTLVVLSAAAGIGFVATLLCYAISSARVFAVQPLLLGVTLAVLVASCAVLVPNHGGDGAASALVVASSVQALLAWLALRRVRMESQGFDASRPDTGILADNRSPAMPTAKVSPTCRSSVLPG